MVVKHDKGVCSLQLRFNSFTHASNNTHKRSLVFTMRDSTHTYLTLISLFLTRTAIKTRLLSIVRRGEQRISLVDLEGRLQIIPDFGILSRFRTPHSKIRSWLLSSVYRDSLTSDAVSVF